MEEFKFSGKNILLLCPTDENQYINFHYACLQNKVKNLYRFNFVEYFSKYGIKNTEKYIENFIKDKNIDAVFSILFASEYQLSVEFYSSLKNRAKIVFWRFDDELYFEVYSKYYCQVADAVITTDDIFNYYAYKRLEIPVILYYSSHSSKKNHPIDIKKDIDVSFIGNCKKNDRMEYIDYLKNNGINIKTFGEDSEGGVLEWSKLGEIFSRTKINLNFTKIDNLNWINKDEPLLNRVRQNKGRPIEIALTKSFCLSEYAPSLEYTFESEKEIIFFHDKEQLLEKVKYYLSNEEKRNSIAENAYKRAMENYESEIAIPKVLKELESIFNITDLKKPTNPEIFLSNMFKIKSINGLTFSMFILIRNLKFLYAIELFFKLFKYGILIFILGFFDGLFRSIKNISSLKKCQTKQTQVIPACSQQESRR